MPHMQQPKILDCSLRDGNYTFDFQFTTEDTSVLVEALIQANVEWIECGHGLGLRASEMRKGGMPANDIDYIKAAKIVAPNAKIGMFCIPEIGTPEDIVSSQEAGLYFIRIGSEAVSVTKAFELLSTARDSGLYTMFNLMKTDQVSPKEFGEIAKKVADNGAQVLYCVDSAGGMLPKNVSAYITAAQDCGMLLGFHGHNNLQMAIANSLSALDSGATFIDSSLGGIGRGAGNVPTETLVAVLQRAGYDISIDLASLLHLVQQRISPLIKERMTDSSLDVAAGYAQIHSSKIPELIQDFKTKSRDMFAALVEPQYPVELSVEQEKNVEDKMSESRLMSIDVKSIHEIFKLHAQDPLIIDNANGSIWSYEQTLSMAVSLADRMRSQGVKSGNKIALQLPNSTELAICYIACMLGEFVAVPIHPQTSEDECSAIVQESKAVAHVKETSFCSNLDSNLRDIDLSYINPENLFVRFYTSGTTARPKAVPHTLGNFLRNSMALRQVYDWEAAQRSVTTFHMTYMAGFYNQFLFPMLTGGSVLLRPAFQASQLLDFWSDLEKYGVNVLWLAPTMMAMLLEIDRSDGGAQFCCKLNTLLSCTAPLPQTIKRRFEDRYNVKVCESYGLSELLVLTAQQNNKKIQAGDNVGFPIPGVSLRTVDNDRSVLASGCIGEIEVRSQHLSDLKNEWIATGDLGCIDSSGAVQITGRIKEIIIKGGVNICPAAVEQVITTHEVVAEAAVLGIPHQLYGEDVVAIVKLFNVCNQDAEIDRIKRYLGEKLAPHQYPTHVLPIDEFPKTDSGKIAKSSLRAWVLDKIN